MFQKPQYTDDFFPSYLFMLNIKSVSKPVRSIKKAKKTIAVTTLEQN
jgi:hypothetical protein